MGEAIKGDKGASIKLNRFPVPDRLASTLAGTLSSIYGNEAADSASSSATAARGSY